MFLPAVRGNYAVFVMSVPKGGGRCGCASSWRLPSPQLLCFSLRESLLVRSCSLTASIRPPEFQVICLDAGIILASGRITVVGEATCLLQTDCFDILLRGVAKKKDKQRSSSFDIAGLGLTENENLKNTVLPGRRMSSKIPVFQTKLFWGSELKTKRCNFSQSCEKALGESVSPQP